MINRLDSESLPFYYKSLSLSISVPFTWQYYSCLSKFNQIWQKCQRTLRQFVSNFVNRLNSHLHIIVQKISWTSFHLPPNNSVFLTPPISLITLAIKIRGRQWKMFPLSNDKVLTFYANGPLCKLMIFRNPLISVPQTEAILTSIFEEAVSRRLKVFFKYFPLRVLGQKTRHWPSGSELRILSSHTKPLFQMTSGSIKAYDCST